MNYERELQAARECALAAGAVQAENIDRIACVEHKNDRSPVTEIDRRCETLIREKLLKAFPGDGFLGEEFGEIPGDSGRVWVVDPIDGTRPYLRGIPTYSVLIGLLCREKPVVGVMRLEGMNETYWAAEGRGAYCDGVRIAVSDTADLSRAMGSALGWVEDRGDDGARLLELMRSCDYAYGFMDAYSYACVARGRLDFCVNLLDQPWDSAAAACIVREAGGMFTDLRGEVSVRSGSSVMSNGELHRQVLDRMARP